MKTEKILDKFFNIENRYFAKFEIIKTNDRRDFPKGVKYTFLCFEKDTENKILFDNHFPKGPHCHVNDKEFKYEYKSIEKTILDFKKLVLKHMGVKL